MPMLAHLGTAQAMLGQLSRARTSVKDALDAGRLAPPARLLGALIYAGLSEIQSGDFRAAHAFAREAHELADGLAPSSFTAAAHALLATTRLELGNPQQALVLSTSAM